MVCESDFWNRQIDERVGQYLHEQKQVDQFLSALSSFPSTSPSVRPPTVTRIRRKSHTKNPSIDANSSSSQFDVFLKSIRKLWTLGEARRLKADVERELRSARLAVYEENKELDNAGPIHQSVDKAPSKGTRKSQKYVERLIRAKSAIDSRIVELSGGSKPFNSRPTSVSLDTSQPISLYAILSNPSSLAYWLEFMDRRHRSRLVQYWLTIEGFKDPLEATGTDVSEGSKPTERNIDDTTIEDAQSLYATYFSAPQSASVFISPQHQQMIETAASSSHNLSPQDIARVRRAVFASQREVYEQMEDEDWSAFSKSELYLKAVGDMQRTHSALKNASAVTADVQQPDNRRPTLSRTPSPMAQVHHSLPRHQIPALFHRPLHQITPQTPKVINFPKPHSPTPVSSPSFSPDPGSIQRKSHSLPPTIMTAPTTPGGPSISVSEFIRADFPPSFARSVSVGDSRDSRNNNSNDSAERRKGSANGMEAQLHSPSPSLSPSYASAPLILSPKLVSPPPPSAKHSSQLNFLIGNAENGESDGRDRLFGDEPDDSEEREREEEARRIEAIQAALSEIIADDNGKRSNDGTPSDSLMSERENPRKRGNDMSNSLILGGAVDKKERKRKSRSLEDLKSASLLSSTTFPLAANLSQEPVRNSSKLLFEDDLPEDGLSTTPSEEEDNDIPHDVPLPAPGDLQLTTQISELDTKLIELDKQNELLSTLIRQAELTGNQKELKILRKSQSSVQRETRAKQWQKQGYERVQDESRLVPSRTRVSIPSAAVAEDTENTSASTLGVVMPKQVVRYTIHVCQIDDGHPAVKWVVSRRYNEFWELDKNLKEWASEHGDLETTETLRKVEIPGKSLVGGISASFVESRRMGLEKYLQGLMTSPTICDSPHLRSFLSRSNSLVPSETRTQPAVTQLTKLPHNLMKTFYKSISLGPSSDDMFNANMADVMYSGLTRQINDLGGFVGLGLGSPEVEVKEGHVEVTRDVSVEGMTSFTGPICDLFIELFDLKEKNWLRRQAVIVILQQFLGGTIERKVRDYFRSVTSQSSFLRILQNLQDTLFPSGERRTSTASRSEEEKAETRARAGKKLGLLIPDVAANMIGRGNARRAARRVFGVLQDERLNQQLMLRILDSVLETIFPPMEGSGVTH